MNTQYLVTERTECAACEGVGMVSSPPTQCPLCNGIGGRERRVDLLDVLKRLKLTMEGDTDGNSHWAFVTDVEVMDE